MEAKDFIDLILDNSQKWQNKDNVKQTENLISYCYDVLCSDKELARVSEELAATKQYLIEANQKNEELAKRIKESDNYQAYWLKSSQENTLLRSICKNQNDLINLR